jgi:hypothetical protein
MLVCTILWMLINAKVGFAYKLFLGDKFLGYKIEYTKKFSFNFLFYFKGLSEILGYYSRNQFKSLKPLYFSVVFLRLKHDFQYFSLYRSMSLNTGLFYLVVISIGKSMSHEWHMKLVFMKGGNPKCSLARPVRRGLYMRHNFS